MLMVTASTTPLSSKTMVCQTLMAADGASQEHTESNPGLADTQNVLQHGSLTMSSTISLPRVDF